MFWVFVFCLPPRSTIASPIETGIIHERGMAKALPLLASLAL